MTSEEALKKIKAEIKMYDEESIESVEWEECYEALEQNPYKDFCEFVAKMVLRDDFEENAGANAELLCRKLSKLGIVKADKDKWVLAESEDKE